MSQENQTFQRVAKALASVQFSACKGSINLTRLEAWEVSFPDLCKQFAQPRITPDKKTAGYFLRCLAPERKNELCADSSDLLIIDADKRIDETTGEIISGAPSPIEPHWILQWLGLEHFIYTSHSNDTGLWKYRILIPYSYTRDSLQPLLNWLFDRFHENDCLIAPAAENQVWAQAWFFPSCHPDRSHLFKTLQFVDGVASVPMKNPDFEPFSPFAFKPPIPIPPSPVKEFTPTVNAQAVTQNPITEFNARFTKEQVLLKAGYKKVRDRFLSPNSTSGEAGVRFLDGGAYSSHDDQLNDGKAHDAFDCFRTLFCDGDWNKALAWNEGITKANQRAYMMGGVA